MIVTSIKMKGRQEKRLEIMQSLNGITAEVKQSPGCIGANCYQDLDDRDIFFHVQEWQSREDLEAHRNSKLFAALLGLKSILADEPQVEIMYRNTSLN